MTGKVVNDHGPRAVLIEIAQVGLDVVAKLERLHPHVLGHGVAVVVLDVLEPVVQQWEVPGQQQLP